jgi:hypothetical protein
MVEIKLCKNCKKEFAKSETTSRKSWAKQSFCSHTCAYDFKRVELICKNCSTSFKTIKARKDTNVFCSMKCCAEYRSKFPEQYNGFKKGHKDFGQKPWLGKKFTDEHKKNISLGLKDNPLVLANAKIYGKNHSGENHWNWKGGITPANVLIRNSYVYHKWRKSVYARDYWTCQDCGLKCKKKDIVAHHIKSFEEHPELRFYISNGITLCRSCHKKRHKEIGADTQFKTGVMV